MARGAKPTTKDIESLKHREARRKHIPTAELETLVSDDEQAPKTIRWKRITDLDPQRAGFQWRRRRPPWTWIAPGAFVGCFCDPDPRLQCAYIRRARVDTGVVDQRRLLPLFPPCYPDFAPCGAGNHPLLSGKEIEI